jgi:hypothetical protein
VSFAGSTILRWRSDLWLKATAQNQCGDVAEASIATCSAIPQRSLELVAAEYVHPLQISADGWQLCVLAPRSMNCDEQQSASHKGMVSDRPIWIRSTHMHPVMHCKLRRRYSCQSSEITNAGWCMGCQRIRRSEFSAT